METPFYIALAEQTLREIKLLFESQPAFKPMLLVHMPPADRAHQDEPPTRVIALSDHSQEQWPQVIRKKVLELGAHHWSVATEVSMRYRVTGDEVGDRVVKVEEWLIYLLSYQGGMLVWGAPVKKGRKLGRLEDLTDDRRVQQMLAHLSEANGVEYN